MRARRYLVLVLAVSLCASLGVSTGASAHKVSTKSAERAAFRVAESVGRQSGASLWYAGVCRSRAAHRVVCWGAVVYDNYEGCAQQIRVTANGHQGAGRKLRTKRVGRTYCADLSEEYEQSGGGSSGSGGEWAICGIRSSVCIGS